MTTLRLTARGKGVARWDGRCRYWECGKKFRVVSEQWQTKVEVLSVLSDLPHRIKGHVHGNQRVTGFHERGGE